MRELADSSGDGTMSDSGLGKNGLPLQRVRKAYEQVYDQLRTTILAGDLAHGERLPPEVTLAVELGVSRGTVREALRLLVAEGLIRTAKGAGGGSFVTLPTVDHISEFVQRNVELLSEADDVTLSEFLEARELIEVFAVRQAALRRTDQDIERLRATISDDTSLSPEAKYRQNKEFHLVLVDVCGNTLLKIAAQPTFAVLQTHLVRSDLSDDFSLMVCTDHRGILNQIEAGSADQAEQHMRDHLVRLSAVYQKIWRRSS